MNENYSHPEKPAGSDQGILKGMYLFKNYKGKGKAKVQMLGSGTILREIIKAAETLSKDYGIDCSVWSVTSFNELKKNGMEVERKKFIKPRRKTKKKLCSNLSQFTRRYCVCCFRLY